MTAATADLDFLMSSATEPGDETPVLETTVKPATDDAKGAAEANQRALDAVVDALMPTPKGSEVQPDDEADKGKKTETTTAETKPVVAQPVIHNPQLLRLAGSWGIGPDEAARYATEEGLLGAVALREIRFRNSEAVTTRQRQAESPIAKPDDLAVPEIKLDEDTDPSIKTAVTTLVDYTKKLKTWADEKLAAQEQTIETLRAGQEQAATAETRNREAKIAQLFDEKVKSWGDEFGQLIGVPTDTWKKTGTTEYAELQKLHHYARQRSAGYEVLTGEVPAVDVIAGFLEEGRYALWPERIKTAVRNDISNGLKRQRGGVALRPGKARNESPPEQGDEPAKAAIGDFMAEHGLDPWARRKAV